MNLPDQIAIKDLTPTHADYDGGHLEKCRALYHGGRIFREELNEFLIKRKIEDTDPKHFELRKRRSFYVPYAAGLIDWISAAAFKDGVELRCLNGSEDAKEYYDGLNQDADGRGTPLLGVLKDGLLTAMKFGRAYFFPDFKHPFAKLSEPKTGDARIVPLCPILVNDWEMTESGMLAWTRMYAKENLRSESEPWKRASDTREVWTFFDNVNTTIYELITRRGQTKSQFATKLSQVPHGLQICPTFDVRAPENIWVLDRIYEVAVALFNREASLTWALDMSAYATLVLTLNDTQLNQIVTTELAALRLHVGESAGYIAPPGGIYEPLFKDSDRLKNNLYEVVRSLGVDAAKVPQAGRMSGETINKMREPLDILLESFSQPVIEAVARLLDAVRIKRGDEDVELELIMGGQDGEEGSDESEEEAGEDGADDAGNADAAAAGNAAAAADSGATTGDGAKDSEK